MRGRVTLAVRGWLVCVGIEAGVRLGVPVSQFVRDGWGAFEDYELWETVHDASDVGISAVLLGLVVVAWFLRRVGWWVWWVYLVLLGAGVVLGIWGMWGAWSVMGVVGEVVHLAIWGAVTAWVGWMVLRGLEGAEVLRGAGREERSVEAQAGGTGGAGEVRVLEYARGRGERAWVGVGLVYLVAVMVGDGYQSVQAVGVQWGARWTGNQRMMEVAEAGVLVVGAAVLAILAWQVWARRGKLLRQGMWAIAAWVLAIRMIGMVLSAATLFGGLSWTVLPVGHQMLLGLLGLVAVGPVVCFVMMVWPAMWGRTES